MIHTHCSRFNFRENYSQFRLESNLDDACERYYSLLLFSYHEVKIPDLFVLFLQLLDVQLDRMGDYDFTNSRINRSSKPLRGR